jgi:prolyl-tRNA synthetase
MDATGAQECLLPQLQPAELWRESGRWETYTKAEGIMFSLIDRRNQEMGLGPTHEEVITTIAREMIRSYRQLPLHLYQIQTKFRDEIRPRFGLMRGREFIMKDGYSFHTDADNLRETYDDMYTAYSNILQRCGLKFRAVEADSGAIGGSGSTEFMVLAEAGEDEVLYTDDGQYAANVEKATSLPAEAVPSTYKKFEKLETPNTPTIESLAKFLDCSPTQIVKNVLYQASFDSGKSVLVLVSIRGDQDVNDVKLTNELTKLAPDYDGTTVLALEVPDEAAQQKWAAKPLPLGYIAPNLADGYISAKAKDIVPQFLRLADQTVVDLKAFVTGSNESGYHTVGGNWDKEFPLPEQVVDVRKAQAGRSRRSRSVPSAANGTGHRNRPHLPTGHQIFPGSGGHLHQRNRRGNASGNGLLWRRSVASGPGGGGTVLRQKWDYLAGGHRPLPRHRRDSQPVRRTPGGNCQPASTQPSMLPGSKPCWMTATNGLG